MPDIGALIREHEALLGWVGSISLGLLVLSAVAFPLVVIHLPEDYFVRDRRVLAHRLRRHPVLWWTLTILKNILGVILILMGLAMLLLPGQGLLTILIGIALTNFPGKYALERRIVCRPRVAAALNRIRRSASRPPLELPSNRPQRP